jgi:hypothetical protein
MYFERWDLDFFCVKYNGLWPEAIISSMDEVEVELRVEKEHSRVWKWIEGQMKTSRDQNSKNVFCKMCLFDFYYFCL